MPSELADLLQRGDDILIGYLYLVGDRLAAADVNHSSHLIVHADYLLPLLLCLSLDPPVFVTRQALLLPDAREPGLSVMMPRCHCCVGHLSHLFSIEAVVTLVLWQFDPF